MGRVDWVDVDNRFIARLDTLQDRFPAIRLQLRVPAEFKGVDDDDLFLELQETLILRPYKSNSILLGINPTLCEVTVHVENFWCENESGGNSGMPIRRGTACVSGSFDTFKRLSGTKDKRFTHKPVSKKGTSSAQFVRKPKALQGTGSIRGFTQVLQGGIKLRRMRKHGEQVDATSWWVCIDYSNTHHFHCKSDPKCTPRRGKVAAFTNLTCLGTTELVLKRQADNVHDANAIAVVPPGGERGLVGVVGYVPRELAMCLAPALDAGVIVISGKGVYSDQGIAAGAVAGTEIATGAVAGTDTGTAATPKKPSTRFLIWFRVDRVAGFTSVSSAAGEIPVEKALRAMQRWVPDTEVGSSSNPVER